MTDDYLKPVLADLFLVLRYVASQPSGYAGFEASRAKYLLHTVDAEALKDTLHSVLFVSNFNRFFGPLTKTETAIEQAALRLERMLRTIQMNQQDIQARLTA